MRTIDNLLNQYGESHQNPTNKLLHWLCVPAIFFSIVGLLYALKIPLNITPDLQLNAAILVLFGVVIYYFRLSAPLAVGMLLFSLVCLSLAQSIEDTTYSLWKVSVAIFVVAWAVQFWGHKIEGKKPSFLKDLQFLLIGPAWLMHFIYKALGIDY